MISNPLSIAGCLNQLPDPSSVALISTHESQSHGRAWQAQTYGIRPMHQSQSMASPISERPWNLGFSSCLKAPFLHLLKTGTERLGAGSDPEARARPPVEVKVTRFARAHVGHRPNPKRHCVDGLAGLVGIDESTCPDPPFDSPCRG